MGEAYARLIWALLFATALAFTIVRSHYIRLLAEASKDEPSARTRSDYERLRISLQNGGNFARVYELGLSHLLDSVDRFLGDQGQADRSLPSPFGNAKSAPYWTANSYDRCLLLALAYPIASLWIAWSITGSVYSTEQALGLRPDAPTWARWLLTALVIGFFLSSLGAVRAKARDAFPLFVLYVSISAILCVGSFATAFLVALPVIQTSLFPIAIAGAGTILFAASSAAIASGAGAIAVAAAVAGAIGVAAAADGSESLLIVLAVSTILLISTGIVAHRRSKRRGLMLTAFTVLYLILLPYVANFLQQASTIEERPLSWALLIFFGILPLLVAPFVWVSVGFTRALMRRGLEQKSWWPAWYALVDSLLAFLLFLLLCAASILTLQTFNVSVVSAGGSEPLAVGSIISQLRERPFDPSQWWIYVTLFSPFVPSMFNLALGGFSLARTVPFVPRVALNQLPQDRDIPEHRRWWAASVLSFQWIFGVLFALFFFFGALYLITTSFPQLGGWLLDGARDLERMDLPAKVASLYALSH